jgi:hypothetical protein
LRRLDITGDEMLKCYICEKEFDRVPEDAIPVSDTLWRLSDGSVHDIRKERKGPDKVMLSERSRRNNHTRYHTSRGIIKADCRYCQV